MDLVWSSISMTVLSLKAQAVGQVWKVTQPQTSFAVDMCEDDSLANSLLFPKYLIFRINQPLLP